MINVVVPGILAFLFTLFGWIVEGGFSSSLQNKAMWFFITWITYTFIFGMTGLFFLPLF